MATRALLSLLMLALAAPAAALTDDELRGGWIADVNGQRHVYVLKIRDAGIRGIYCWDCSDPNNLAFIEEGRVEADRITFTVLHDVGPGAPSRRTVRGTLANGRLTLRSERQGASTAPVTEMTLTREPRRPAGAAVVSPEQAAAAATAGGPSAAAAAAAAAAVAAGAAGAAGAGAGAGAAAAPVAVAAPPAPGARARGAGAPDGPPPGAGAPGAGARAGGAGAARGGGGGRGRGRGYVPPGPNEPLTVATITGLWLGGGNGPNKQHFMFRQVGNEIRGLVCGPCDNPYTFGPLDDGVIMGDTFEFNIVHEDWGAGPLPFNNHVTATVSKHEMRMLTQQDNRPPPPAPFEMILIGPIRLEPAR